MKELENIKKVFIQSYFGSNMPGKQVIFKFNNGFGVSLINHEMSYGLEIAVLKFYGNDFDITYDTQITNDVIGYLSEEKAIEIINDISRL